MTEHFMEISAQDFIDDLEQDETLLRVESRETGASFSYYFRRTDSMKQDVEDAWFIRIDEGEDESSYLAFMKRINRDEADELVRRKQEYLRGRGLERIADRCTLEDANIFQAHNNNGGGYVLCRLSKKSFENGFNYKHPAFKGLFYCVRSAFKKSRVKGAKLYKRKQNHFPLPQEDGGELF